jgi:hypothetical protein
LRSENNFTNKFTLMASTTLSKEGSKNSSAENLKGIENHKAAAKHFAEASKHHLDAAKHHEAGMHDKACESAVKAHGHHVLGSEHQKEDAKHHALHQ